MKLNKVSDSDSEIWKFRCDSIPVDTGRKLNAHKTFRRRPGPLLNVLCTFNLRPVSTGINGEAALLKKRLWHMCFPVNLVKFSRTPLYGCLHQWIA